MSVHSIFQLTVVWYDGPGHSRCIDLSNHPEHAQPAEVFASFLPGQHLSEEGENNGHSTSYPATSTETTERHSLLSYTHSHTHVGFTCLVLLTQSVTLHLRPFVAHFEKGQIR